MDYTLQLRIDAAPDRVWRALSDPATWPDWQLGLTDVSDAGGSPGEPGSRRELRFELPGNSMAMRETLAASVAPSRYDAIYESGPVWNLCENTLEADGDATSWTQRNTWRFDGITPTEDDRERFEATTRDAMDRFRRYVEDGTTVPRSA